MDNQSRLVIRRTSEYMNRARSYKVMIDSVETGAVKNGQAEEFTIAPGTHKIFCKVDWCSSREVEIKPEAGETTYLHVKSGMKYYMQLVIPLVAILFINFYLIVSHTPKPYWFNILLGIVALPVCGYIFYYTVFNRKDYLSLTVDEKGMFGS